MATKTIDKKRPRGIVLKKIPDTASGAHDYAMQMLRKEAEELFASLQLALYGKPAEGVVAPVAWIRRHADGNLTNEIIVDWQIEDVRKLSGTWEPLGFITPTPVAQTGDSSLKEFMRESLQRYDMETDQQLKPCPFCGDTELEGGKPFALTRGGTPVVIRCGNPLCGAEVERGDCYEAVRVWNNRTEQQPPQAQKAEGELIAWRYVEEVASWLENNHYLTMAAKLRTALVMIAAMQKLADEEPARFEAWFRGRVGDRVLVPGIKGISWCAQGKNTLLVEFETEPTANDMRLITDLLAPAQSEQGEG